MYKKEFFIGMLAAFLCLGLVGTVFAAGSNFEPQAAIGTEAGDWEFNFDALDTKASEAARSHVYNYESLAVIGTEAGDWEFNFDAPDTKATEAARNYKYNYESLAVIGTEAGDWEFNFDASDTKASEAVATEGDNVDAMCSEC